MPSNISFFYIFLFLLIWWNHLSFFWPITSTTMTAKYSITFLPSFTDEVKGELKAKSTEAPPREFSGIAGKDGLCIWGRERS